MLTGEAGLFPSAVVDARRQIGRVGFAIMLVGCGTFGMILNFSQFLCTLVNSALTTTVTGVLKVTV